MSELVTDALLGYASSMEPLEVVVRRAAPGDAPLLAVLSTHGHAPHAHAEPHLYRRETDPEELTVLYAQRLLDPEVVIFIAHVDVALGYAVTTHKRLPQNPFSPARERFILEEIAVVATQRRLGVGRLLMRAAEQRAQEVGVHSVQLDVRAFNTEALRFYESLGYATVQMRLERGV